MFAARRFSDAPSPLTGLRQQTVARRPFRPVDGVAAFARNAAMLEEMGVLAPLRAGVGLVCVAIGLNAFLLDAVAAPWTTSAPLSIAIALIVTLPSVIWGVRLAVRRTIGYRESVAFVAYCNVSIVLGALMTPSIGVSIAHIGWLIGISAYVSAFHGRLTATTQVLITVSASITAGAVALHRGAELLTVISLVGTASIVVFAVDLLIESLEQQFETHSSRLFATTRQDELTGLLNRRGLAAACADLPHPITVALLDLDGFKAINDTHGHATGDRVLVRTAHHLRSLNDDGALIARLGGDEFAVVGATIPVDLDTQLDAVSAGDPYPVVASVGFAHGPAEHLDNLLAQADTAMYAAKKTNRHPRIA